MDPYPVDETLSADEQNCGPNAESFETTIDFPQDEEFKPVMSDVLTSAYGKPSDSFNFICKVKQEINEQIVLSPDVTEASPIHNDEGIFYAENICKEVCSISTQENIVPEPEFKSNIDFPGPEVNIKNDALSVEVAENTCNVADNSCYSPFLVADLKPCYVRLELMPNSSTSTPDTERNYELRQPDISIKKEVEEANGITYNLVEYYNPCSSVQDACMPDDKSYIRSKLCMENSSVKVCEDIAPIGMTESSLCTPPAAKFMQKENSVLCTNKTPFSCCYCRSQFKQKGSLQSHLKFVHGINEVKQNETECDVEDVAENLCIYCNKIFETNYDLRCHLKKHIDDNSFFNFLSLNEADRLKLISNFNVKKKLFPCIQCPFIFSHYSLLKQHLKTHSNAVPSAWFENNIKSYVCTSEKFLNKSALNKPLHMSEKLYSCSHCSKKFKTNQALAIHSVVHTGHKPYPCNFCPKKFNQPNHLKTHLMRHTGVRPFSCGLCSAKFIQKAHLLNHLKKHSNSGANSSSRSEKNLGENQFLCVHCSAVFRFKWNLKRHMASHIDSNKITTSNLRDTSKNEIACSVCPKKCLSQAGLKRHLRKHTDQKLFSSTLCFKKFKGKGSLGQHLKIRRQKSYTCAHCPKKFKQQISLRNHLKEHSKNHPNSSEGFKTNCMERTSFSCSYCFVVFKLENQLTEHLKLHSFGDKVLKSNSNNSSENGNTCTICSKKCLSQNGLKRHLAVHTNRRIFSCPHCSKKFKYNHNLRQHLVVHTGEKRYSCIHCPKKFKQLCHLRNHTMRHTGVRPFACELCPARFIQKANLLQHSKIHSNSGTDSCNDLELHHAEKPFSCPYCSAVFRLKRFLTLHMRLHSSDDKVAKLNVSVTHKNENECAVYTETSSSQANLNSHSLMYSGQKVFSCKLCPKKFGENWMLRQHLKVHNIKLCSCTYCPKKFKYPSSLKTHLLCHTGKQQFSCALGSGTQRSTLKSHSKKQVGERPFPCALCSAKFSRKINLLKHLKRHAYSDINSSNNSEKSCVYNQFSCPHCSEVFSFKRHLADHIKLHSPGDKEAKSEASVTHKNENKCSVNAEISSNQATSKTNWLKHSNKKVFSCSHCPKKFKHKSTFCTHLRVHTGERPFTCRLCSAKFATKGSLGTHEMTHIDERPFPCTMCPAKFIQSYHLKRHLKKHSADVIPSNRLKTNNAMSHFLCSYCSAKYTRKSALTRHLKLHVSVSVSKVGKSCSTKFATKSRVSRHLRVLTSERPFHCTSCPAKFIQSVTLKRHLLIHSNRLNTNSVFGRFLCFYCSAIFKRKCALTKHLKLHVSNNEVPKLNAGETCENKKEVSLCSGRSSESKSTDHPKKSTQNPENKPYKCSTCPAKFKLQINLKNHLLVHSGEKPYSCPHCPAKYAQKGNLQSHMNVHSDLAWGSKMKVSVKKLNVCALCNAKFELKCHLTRHIKKHIKEEPIDHRSLTYCPKIL